jgi:hypothetical protein
LDGSGLFDRAALRVGRTDDASRKPLHRSHRRNPRIVDASGIDPANLSGHARSGQPGHRDCDPRDRLDDWPVRADPDRWCCGTGVLDGDQLGEWCRAVICQECGKKEAEEQSDRCFRCRIATIRFGWRGGGFAYGRSNFSARTNAEFLNEHVGDVRDNERYAPVEQGVWT